MESDTKKSGVWKWLLPILVVMIVAFCILAVKMKSAGGRVPGDKLQEGKDYLISVALVELNSTKSDGKAWDIDKSGPDIYLKIKWRGDVVYTSSVKENTLIAQWPEHELDVMKTIRTGVADASKHGARIRVRPADFIEVEVLDKDLLKDDPAATMKINTETLKVGKNTLKPKDSDVSRLELRVTPLETP